MFLNQHLSRKELTFLTFGLDWDIIDDEYSSLCVNYSRVADSISKFDKNDNIPGRIC